MSAACICEHKSSWRCHYWLSECKTFSNGGIRDEIVKDPSFALAHLFISEGASLDHIDFLVPVRVGDLVILRIVSQSSLSHFHGSRRQSFRGKLHADTAQHVASAYLTFVAIDPMGKRLTVAPVIPETDDQRRRYDDAGRRRDLRRSELDRRRKSGRV